MRNHDAFWGTVRLATPNELAQARGMSGLATVPSIRKRRRIEDFIDLEAEVLVPETSESSEDEFVDGTSSEEDLEGFIDDSPVDEFKWRI